MFVVFARQLASQGHPVMRVDYAGNGDSPGEFADSTVETAIRDVSAAISFLKRQTNCTTIGLVGLRFGAVVAARVAEREDDVDTLVLWSPLTNGKQYVKELLRINLTTQLTAYGKILRDRDALVEALGRRETVNVDGYEMSLAMHDELTAIDAPATAMLFQGRCLVVNIDPSPEPRPRADLTALASLYFCGEMISVLEEPFWKEIETLYESAPRLSEATIDWLRRRG